MLSRLAAHLDDAIYALGNKVARQTKADEASRNAPEPVEVLDILTGNETKIDQLHHHTKWRHLNSPVHTPDTSHNVHWQHNRAEHGQLA